MEEAAERADVACVVITGAGRAFSAGQDLGEMGRLSAATNTDFGDAGPGFPRFLDTLAAFGKPVIAAVNGIGVGIGMTMLLHVDIAIIASTARLRAPFVPLGVVPEAAGSLLMPIVMGNSAPRSSCTPATGSPPTRRWSADSPCARSHRTS